MPIHSSLRILGQALRDLERSFVPLVGFDIVFRVMSSLLLAPLTATLLLVLIRTTGHDAIGNFEIAEFLLSPVGVLAILVSGITGLFLVYLEHAGLVLIAEAALRGRRLSSLSAFLGMLRGMPRLLALGTRQFLLLASLGTPFLLAVGAVYAALWSGFDLYYLTTTKPPRFWVGAGVAGLLLAVYGVLAIRLALRWLVAVPALLLEGAGPIEAMRRSTQRTRRGWKRNLTVFVLIFVGVVGTEAAVLAAFTYLGDLAVNSAQDSETLLIWLGVLVAINVAIVSAFGFLGTALNALAIVRIDQEWRTAESSTQELPDSLVVLAPRHTPRQARLTLLGTLGAMIVMVSLATHTLIESLDLRPSIAITAHRGDAARAPENTLAAIELAIEAGADYAEIDVQLSADGVVFVFHDEDLRRIAGDPRRVTALSFDELSQIDAGSWVDPKFRDQRIPSLESVIEAARDRIGLNIELKFPTDGSALAPLAKGVIEVVRRSGAADQCVLSSLSFQGLDIVRREAPDLTIGSIVFQAVGNPARLDVDFLSVREAVATDTLIARAHRAGMEVHVWSVSDPDRLFGLLSRGVDNVITSRPSEMVAKRAELAELGNVERLLLRYREGLSWWR